MRGSVGASGSRALPLPPAAVRSKIRWNWTTSTRRAFDVARLGIPGIANSRHRLPVHRRSSARLPGVLKAVPPDKASAFLISETEAMPRREIFTPREIRRKVASSSCLLEILLHHAREYIYIYAFEGRILPGRFAGHPRIIR